MKGLSTERIFLVGFMGSGKSTFGKKLANKLGYEFVDLDAWIEKDLGKSIPQLFENEGENAFRELEKQALEQVLEQTNVVISTGGGTPCYFDNMQKIVSAGLTIYLKLGARELTARLLDSKTERPLVIGKSPEALYAFVQEKLEEREPFYTQAHKSFRPLRNHFRELLKEVTGVKQLRRLPQRK